MPRKESIVTPSYCPSCNKHIALYDNIPILSYFILSGQCRQCKSEISPRYFIVEFITGMLTVLIITTYGISPEMYVYMFFVYMFIVITFIDVEHDIIPNEIILLGIGLVFFAHLFEWLPISKMDGFYGVLAFGGLLYGIRELDSVIFKKDRIGFGNVKLGLLTGGLIGLELAILALFLSFMISALFTCFGLDIIKLKKKGKFLFEPFLALGILMVFLTHTICGGNAIIYWYYTIMNYD